MITSHYEAFLAASVVVALGIVLWLLVTNLKAGAAQIGDVTITRAERPFTYAGIMAFFGAVAVVNATVALKLIFDIEIGFWL